MRQYGCGCFTCVVSISKVRLLNGLYHCRARAAGYLAEVPWAEARCFILHATGPRSTEHQMHRWQATEALHKCFNDRRVHQVCRETDAWQQEDFRPCCAGFRHSFSSQDTCVRMTCGASSDWMAKDAQQLCSAQSTTIFP